MIINKNKNKKVKAFYQINKAFIIALLMLFAVVLPGCAVKTNVQEEEVSSTILSGGIKTSESNAQNEVLKEIERKKHQQSKHSRREEQELASATDIPMETKKIIVLDPGHASSLNYEYEPIGPGAIEKKMATVIGTRGVTTGIYEYELVMEFSQLLRDELVRRGYTVIMTKESNEIVLTNVERAQIANNANADAFLRMHADASDNPEDSGAMAMCVTANNPYNPAIYSRSRHLAECVLNTYCATTEFQNRGVVETDEMTGNNWSQVPCILMELGYLTNFFDEQRMTSVTMQYSMAKGIADGLDIYFDMQ